MNLAGCVHIPCKDARLMAHLGWIALPVDELLGILPDQAQDLIDLDFTPRRKMPQMAASSDRISFGSETGCKFQKQLLQLSECTLAGRVELGLKSLCHPSRAAVS